jgi:hypothetical protein
MVRIGGDGMEHEHEWEVRMVAVVDRVVSQPHSVSAEDDEAVSQAKIIYGCACGAMRTEKYEGPPEGLPRPPVPEEIRMLAANDDMIAS